MCKLEKNCYISCWKLVWMIKWEIQHIGRDFFYQLMDFLFIKGR